MDLDELRALAVDAKGHDVPSFLDLRQEMTPETALALLDKIETLHAVLQDIMTEELIPDGYPLLMARAKAALDGGGA